MNNYPDYQTYRKLYASYFARDPKELFENIDVKDKSILDLCCGEGRAAKAAKELGARFVMGIDENSEMLNRDNFDSWETYVSVQEYSNWLFEDRKFDIIICQQGINYWLLNENLDLKRLFSRLSEGGIFIFNTFNTKPDKIPHKHVLCYEINDLNYYELSYLIDNKIYHIQACEGIAPHLTSFDWITGQQFREKLEPYFECEEIIKNKTSIWKCYKK